MIWFRIRSMFYFFKKVSSSIEIHCYTPGICAWYSLHTSLFLSVLGLPKDHLKTTLAVFLLYFADLLTGCKTFVSKALL